MRKQPNLKHLIPDVHFMEAVKTGSLVKVRKAALAGQPLTPKLNASAAMSTALFSPLACAYRWPWHLRPDSCVETLQVLLDAGADPNMPDENGRRSLHHLIWLVDNLPHEALEVMIKGGADLALTAYISQGRSAMDGVSLCILESKTMLLPALFDLDPGLVQRCPPPGPMLTLAWNDSTFNDQKLRDLVFLFMGAGADPDLADEFNRSGFNQNPRLASAVTTWRQMKASQAEEDMLNQSTPSVATPSSRAPRL